MSTIYLSETELKKTINQIYKQEKQKVILEKWNKLSDKDKRFVLEFLKIIYPEKAQIIREGKWYNTLGDIVGIFDPTGVVDLINGISYWRQGDKLYAILSWISVIPYLGDVIGKSVIGLFKMGGVSAKAFKAAALAGDSVKMGQIAAKGGPLKNLLKKATEWGPKILEPLKRAISKVPGVGPGLVRAVEDYIKLFTNASKKMDQGAKIATNLVNKRALVGKLSAREEQLLDKALRNATEFRGFRDFKGKGGLAAGMGRLWGNRGTRGLMRRTKWYLGLLDFLGVANFVGPDELEQQIPDLESKINEYNKTDEADKFAREDYSEFESTRTTAAPPPPPSSDSSTSSSRSGGGMDAVQALASLFGGSSSTGKSGLSLG